ncbi:MAG: cell division protein ZipA [Acinetobacter populi]|jgi:cell division protein ZipA|uniref:cell division protein ZipA C-terminal FtsZ-binding domain-containing protein n=1 Tax=Acinetobacter populi TaxID=1582270 RepID=UPI002355F2F5|nr:cell division protein ZipA C-terminal FtsZ-binding domain-containing protein [Acinetobacter populi]MCH4248363.1 cell division protein ZipA [Acinetobacter populi]
MDQAWEIIGIVIAVLMVIIGLRLLLKKPQTSQPIEQTELIVDAQSQQPIVPRHLRPDAVKVSSTAVDGDTPVASAVATQDAQPPSSAEQPTQQDVADQYSDQTVTALQASTKTEQPDELDELIEQLKDEAELVDDAKQVIADQDSTPEIEIIDTLEVEKTQDNSPQDVIVEDIEIEEKDDVEKISVDEIERVEWENEADVIDAHLNEQNRQDEESALAKAQQLIALYMYPNPGRALSGERTLKMLLKYGLRYGEMSCFHRYEDADKPSPLMFSVLRINEDGAPSGFDLETLPSEEVKGLAFFLALPNPHAVTGFDMMVSLAGLMARDTDGMVFDEQSLELTPQLRDHWRHFVIEYKPV